MASGGPKLSPQDGEALSTFLNRAIDADGVSLNAVSRRLSALDGKSEKDWGSKLNRWRRGDTKRLFPQSAELLAEALNADFSPFSTGKTAPRRDVIAEMQEAIRVLRRDLAVLQTHLAALQEPPDARP